MKNLLLILIVVSNIACKTEQKEETSKVPNIEKNYTLVGDDINILVEKFDSSSTHINRYNDNNIVFKVGTTFTYKYNHTTTNGEKLYFIKDINNQQKWLFVPEINKDSTTITAVVISVLNGNPMADRMPDYNQTNIKYQLNNSNSYSTSGVIENEANIWMHPPREAYFRILELNPFPYIKAPYKIGTAWTWSLNIGSNWGDERWKIWEGGITNEYTYEITGKKVVKTNLGDIECFVIKSEATSRIGKTSLTAYFNETYGFVTLDYTNIDGSKTLLELTDYTN